MTGTLYGVGLGPGDPELVTVKAARIITAAEVIAYHSARHGRSIARGVAAPYLRDGQIEEQLVYPLTVETTTHPGGYAGAMSDFYTESAARLAAHLDAGRDVVVLAEGDPMFYGSYMHMHKRLCDRYPTVVIPGVTSVSAASAVLRRPLVEGEEVLTVLPGTLPAEDLEKHLAATDSAAVLKLGRTFPKVRAAFEAAGKLDRALYVERATWDTGRVLPLSEVDPDTVPYFSLAVLPSPINDSTPPPVGTPRPNRGQSALSFQDTPDGSCQVGADAALWTTPGEVVVVGLGPAGRPWLTPEAQDALATADDLVGYTTYLNRVPANPRQRRHLSDNQVEAERAAFALDLAKRGRRVAVVSSGDPGVFAMATAVLEVADDPLWRDVPVRVLPGVTAAHAVAAKAGAPLGHDYCTISLSDRLKPWDVITRRLAAAAEADFAIAIYNPASKSRTWQLAEARDVLLEHRSPDTPVVIGRDVGGPEETLRITRLADLDPTTVDMRCLLLIGSSRTRTIERPDGSLAVVTPRTYPGR
ncbi:precorrin-2 C(20)-methyltransferase [Actinokineospora soli]